MSQTATPGTPLPGLALWLGYGGLLPFLAGALAVWLVPPGLQPQAHAWLLHYGAVILTFVGAVHWGLAFRLDNGMGARQVVSILPSLWAWVALGLPPVWGYLLVMSGLLGMLAYDRGAATRALTPAWYTTLRLRLTLTATLCLGAALAAWLLRG